MATKKENALLESYQRNPTLKNYVALRRNSPSTQISSKIIDIEEIYQAVWDIEDELRDFDISSEVLVDAMDGHHAAISELCLTLMELLVERDAMQKSKRTHLISRGEVISNVLVNRLIGMMFEGVDRSGTFHMNPDLIVLIKYQLTGPIARLGKQRERKLSIDDVREAVIELAKAGTNPSLRAIARRFGVNATTVLRSVPRADLQRIQAAYRPSNASKPDHGWNYAFDIIRRYTPEGTGVDCRAFILAAEIILANPNLQEAELLPKVEDALRGSGAHVPRRVAPEV